MKASEWIDRVKTAKGWESDYRVAKELGITQSAVSRIRIRDDATLSEETAVKVAQMLGFSPAGIVLDQVAQRSKSAVVRTALAREVERLCILCKQTGATKRIAGRARFPAFSAGNGRQFQALQC